MDYGTGLITCKLVSGEEVIAELTGFSDRDITVTNPMKIHNNSSLNFLEPWINVIPNTDIVIRRDTIIAMYQSDDTIVDLYKKRLYETKNLPTRTLFG